jgi:hypothetical protein
MMVLQLSCEKIFNRKLVQPGASRCNLVQLDVEVGDAVRLFKTCRA